MTRRRVTLVVLAAVAFVAAAASSASAQYLGTLRWQLAPFCNVVTLDAVQQVNTISLAGFDDQCGAPVTASASGAAHLNPNGTISVALTVTRPDGLVISTNVEVNIASISGPWKDDGGNSGTFVFNPTSPAAGAPRRITLKGVYSAGFTAAGANEVQGDAVLIRQGVAGAALGASGKHHPVWRRCHRQLPRQLRKPSSGAWPVVPVRAGRRECCLPRG